ncbi:MAG TPA: 4-hydroxy-tetrahydrodipicolinate reductase [Gammaproteobacteria bacterium]|jgi:4-hydroxy-tetrahydrodipicolinate reductase|nr:4-hydroxy-tetrahydrodipicolinate reductase [Gammaproteobacteria bacterium]
MLKVAISGSTGRMGKALIKAIGQNEDFELVGGVAGQENKNIGKDLGEIAEVEKIGIPLSSNLYDLSEEIGVLIDFSEAKFSLKAVEYSKNLHIPLVLATTGYEDEDLNIIRKASQFIPLLQASNTSLGIAFLKKIIDLTSDSFSYFDNLEILETHHQDKKDSPSGTALDLANFLSERIKGKDSIPIESQRTGDTAGEHKIILSKEAERIELTHKALDRSIYAKGALAGAKWLNSKPNGLYSMSDIYS